MSLNNMRKRLTGFIDARRAEMQRGKTEFQLDKIRRENRRMKKLCSMPDGTVKNIRMGIRNKRHPMDIMNDEWRWRKQRREEKYGEEVSEP